MPEMSPDMAYRHCSPIFPRISPQTPSEGVAKTQKFPTPSEGVECHECRPTWPTGIAVPFSRVSARRLLRKEWPKREISYSFGRSRKKTLYICKTKSRVMSMFNDHYTIEICAPSYESAIAAQRGGAARIELCSELPRSGDFLYSSYEVETVTRDIALCAQAGVQGVVVGALTADAKVDRTAAAEWLKEARRHGLSTTFHRAIDCADSIYDALEDVASLGYDRVLTSGGCPTAWEGRETIARMQAMMANHTGSAWIRCQSDQYTRPGLADRSERASSVGHQAAQVRNASALRHCAGGDGSPQ